MTNSVNAAAEIRELTAEELDMASGAFIKVEQGHGLTWIGIGDYGIWWGNGCVGVTTSDKVVGVCKV